MTAQGIRRNKQPIEIMQPGFSAKTSNGKPVEVTWSSPAVTFGVLNARFQRQEVGFHVSDLPERFLSWICFYATYKSESYVNQSF